VVPSNEVKEMSGALKAAGNKITKETLAPLNATERKTFLALLAKIL
jgi:hypothetical protein